MVECQCSECKIKFEYEYRISICKDCLLKKGLTVEGIFNKGLSEGRRQPLSKIRFRMERLVFSIPQPAVLKEKFDVVWAELEKEVE
jgi:hypothetical protein